MAAPDVGAPAGAANASASLAGFIDKWRLQWPEWSIVAVFVPLSERERVAAWFALLQELREAAWGGSDPTPGLAKLAWWQEELRGWQRGARRHPLGERLQKLEAPWTKLADALSGLPSTRAPAAADEATALDTFAAAVLACEQALFAGAVPAADDRAALVAAFTAERALVQGDAGAAAAMHDAIPNGPAMTRPRRLQHAILATRLQRMAAGNVAARLPALRLLFAGWRAARRG